MRISEEGHLIAHKDGSYWELSMCWNDVHVAVPAIHLLMVVHHKNRCVGCHETAPVIWSNNSSVARAGLRLYMTEVDLVASTSVDRLVEVVQCNWEGGELDQYWRGDRDGAQAGWMCSRCNVTSKTPKPDDLIPT